MSKTTIKNLASSLGVSTATVSRAFTGKGRISDRTRIKILKKAEEVGYRANIYARSLTGKSSETIGLFYPSLVNGEPDYFINEIMSGISETIAGSNKNLQIFPIQQKMAEKVIEFYKDVIFNGSISAVIVIYGSLSAITLVEMAKSVNIPYIVIGDIEGEEKNSISYHIENGAQQVGEYLLTSGKKKPAYVGGVNDSPKRKGFLRGLGCLAGKIGFIYNFMGKDLKSFFRLIDILKT
ncbi:MAG: LacI family DNA-binding transcriptional regulator, partial [Verrucomicrobiota bacterium]|nr:LacI family DNA-binding transcriptional regulator [Verrucomicrobiota bacterium]